VPTPTAIILSIGDELILGQCEERNAAFLANRLQAIGIRPVEHRTLGDDRDVIARAIGNGASAADVVIVTGGLGPTADDVTRHALADALGQDLQLDETSLAELEAFFRERGRPLLASNRIQAMIPRGTRAIPNSVGTAPGIVAGLADATVFCLPGVPHEMRVMFDTDVLPALADGEATLALRTIHTFGLPESEVGRILTDLMTATGPVRVGTTAKMGVISVRIVAHTDSSSDSRIAANAAAQTVRDRLGPAVFGEDEDTLPSVAIGLLRQAGQTLATAESCTGGMMGQMITSVSGASDVYLGGVVAYANPVKERLLDVPADLLAEHGAVSEPIAAAMAEGARQRFGADWALSATGIAGPTGGTADKPVGLVYMGVAGPADTNVHQHQVLGPREVVRVRSVLVALNALRLALLGA